MILLAVLTIFGFCNGLDEFPSQHKIQSSINRTIEEVERLIQRNSSLPQLSRSQIVDILYNITSSEVDSLEESVEKARTDYQRALMVVLPYNSRDAKNDDIKDLYTKPPIIQMIPDTETMLPFASIQAENPSDNSINFKYSSEINDELGSLEYLNGHKSDLNGEFDSKPEKFSFVLKNLEDIPQDQETSSTKKKHNEINKNSNNKKNNYSYNHNNNNDTVVKPPLDVFYSTIVTEAPTERMPETTLKLNAANPTVPSARSTNVLTFDQWTYFAPPATQSTPTTKKPVTTTTKSLTSTIKSAQPLGIFNRSQSFISVIPTNRDDIITPPPFKNLPDTSAKKPELVSFELGDYEMMNDEPTGPIFVTPMAPESSVADSAASPSSILSLVSSKFPQSQPEVNKNRESVTKPHETVFESLGIDSKHTKLFIEPERINLTYKEPTINSQVPESNILTNQLAKLTTGLANSQINLKKGLSNITPDLRSLFQQFGLQTSEKNKERESHVSTTTKNPVRSFFQNSWSNFKPIPRSQVRDESMKNFLSQFGLTDDNRREKSIKHDDTFRRQSIIDAVPGNMKSILENIGLIVKPRETKRITPRSDNQSNVKNTKSNNKNILNNLNNLNKLNNLKVNENKSSKGNAELNHVFKPHETQISDQKQRDKINELLDTVKMVQEGRAQVTDVRKVANDLLEAAKTLKGGPDPLSLEEIMKIYNDDVRNEVKRQDKDGTNNGSLTSTSTTEASNLRQASNASATDSVGTNTDTDTLSITIDVTTTESTLSTEAPNLADLADSFGGSTAEPDPVLPEPRKSGLYFLLDWNSFLEVGEEDKDRVNLRFAPKVGDRTRFIPVVIP